MGRAEVLWLRVEIMYSFMPSSIQQKMVPCWLERVNSHPRCLTYSLGVNYSLEGQGHSSF